MSEGGGHNSSALRSVLMELGVAVDDTELKRFTKDAEGLHGKLTALGEGLVEALAVEKIGEFFKSQIELAARTQDLSDKLGVGTDELQHFQFAAASVGVAGESAAHSLGFLNKAVGEALLGSKEANEAFSKLHVGLKDTTGSARPVEDVLMDVSDALSKLPDQQTRAAYAMKLFGREGQTLLPILGEGSEKIKEMYDEADNLGIIMGGDFFRDAKKAREEMEHFSMIIQAFKARIVAAALPAITALFHWLQKLAGPLQKLAGHTNALAHGMEFLAAGAALKLLSTGYKLVKMLGLLEAEFLLPLVAIGLLYIAFDDLETLIEGGQSVIGDYFDSMGMAQGKAEFIDEIKAAWDALVTSLKIAGTVLLEVLALLGKGTIAILPELIIEFAKIIKYVAAAIRLVGGFVSAVTSIPEAIRTGSFDPIGKEIDKAGDAVFGKDGIFGSAGIGQTSDKTSDYGAATVEKEKNVAGAGISVPWEHPALASVAGLNQSPNFSGQVDAPDVPSASVPAPSGDTSKMITIAPTIQVTVSPGKDSAETGKKIADAAAEQMQRDRYAALFAAKRP